MRIARCLVLSVLLGLAGCEASCTTAALSEPAVAVSVDATTQAPIDPATAFPSSTGSLRATVKISDAPADAVVSAVFYYLEGGEQQVAADELATGGGTGYVAFTLNPPPSGWPLGAYEVRYLLDGNEKHRLGFRIEESAAAVPGAAATAGFVWDDELGAGVLPVAPGKTDPVVTGPTPTVRRLRDDQFGFSLEVPYEWDYRVTQQGGYLIEGPPGTDAYEVSLIVQMIDKQADPAGTAESQLQEAIDRLSGVPGAEVLRRDTREVSGQLAPTFAARYRARDSRGATQEFAHLQLVLDGGAVWLWVSASAPRPAFDASAFAIEHAIDSFAVGR